MQDILTLLNNTIDKVKQMVYIEREGKNDMTHTEQIELLEVKRDYTKYVRELPEQNNDLSELPLFNLECQHTEQLDLFNH